MLVMLRDDVASLHAAPSSAGGGRAATTWALVSGSGAAAEDADAESGEVGDAEVAVLDGGFVDVALAVTDGAGDVAAVDPAPAQPVDVRVTTTASPAQRRAP
jgi:hypothetical protein